MYSLAFAMNVRRCNECVGVSLGPVGHRFKPVAAKATLFYVAGGAGCLAGSARRRPVWYIRGPFPQPTGHDHDHCRRRQTPDVTIKTNGAQGPEDLSTGEFFKGRKVVLFAVPGAFTPGCSNTHMPGFVVHADEILQRPTPLPAWR